jgi:hypothetical protein
MQGCRQFSNTGDVAWIKDLSFIKPHPVPAEKLLPNKIFLARTRKNVAQDRSVLPVYEDLSNGFDQVDGKKSH